MFFWSGKKIFWSSTLFESWASNIGILNGIITTFLPIIYIIALFHNLPIFLLQSPQKANLHVAIKARAAAKPPENPVAYQGALAIDWSCKSHHFRLLQLVGRSAGSQWGFWGDGLQELEGLASLVNCELEKHHRWTGKYTINGPFSIAKRKNLPEGMDSSTASFWEDIGMWRTGSCPFMSYFSGISTTYPRVIPGIFGG